MITFLLSAVLVAFLTYILVTYIPMPVLLQRVIIVLVAVGLVLWAVRVFGVNL